MAGVQYTARAMLLPHSIQTGSGSHPATIQLVPGTVSPGIRSIGVKLTTHIGLVLRSRMVELYLHSPIHLHGVVFYCARRKYYERNYNQTHRLTHTLIVTGMNIYFHLMVHSYYNQSHTLTHTLIVTGMNIYFHLVVHSYYKQVKSIAPDVSETASRQPSTLSVMKPDLSQPASPLAQYILQVPTLPSIHYPPQKKVSKLGNSTEHLGSTVSWVEKI
jgi:hypothetical protein